MAMLTYIPKFSCICWHTDVKEVQLVMQEEEVVFRSQVTQVMPEGFFLCSSAKVPHMP